MAALLLAGCAGSEPRPEPRPARAVSVRAEAVGEVVALHAFFEDWFGGAVPEGQAGLRRFEQALAPGFTIELPSGEVLDRAAILARVRGAHGLAPGRITVERPLAHVLDDGVVAVCYEEWHERDGARRGRSSRALLRPDPGAPGGFSWLRVEETWLE